MARKLPLHGKILYAASSAGWAMTDRIVVTWLLFYYVSAEGGGPFLGSLAFGSVMILGRVVDAVADPLVALWSDNFRGRLGRRMPFLLAGGMLYVAVFIALFHPPAAAPGIINAVYLTVLTGAYYFFFTVYVCPYLALMPELARTPDDRVDLATLRAVFSLLGVAAALVGSGRLIGSLGFSGMVLGMGLSGMLLMYLPALIKEKDYASAEPASLGLVEAITTTLKNQAFRIYLAGNATFWFGFNIVTLGLPFYVTVLLSLDKEATSIFFAATFGVAVLCFPLVNILAKRIGHKAVMLGSLFLFVLVLPCFFFLGRPLFCLSSYSFAMLLLALAGVPLSSLFVLPDAMVASITDLEEGLSGQRREAMYFGTQGLVLKVVLGLSTFVTGVILQIFGSTAATPLGVRLTGVVAAFFVLIGFFIFLRYPEKEVLAPAGSKNASI